MNKLFIAGIFVVVAIFLLIVFRGGEKQERGTTIPTVVLSPVISPTSTPAATISATISGVMGAVSSPSATPMDNSNILKKEDLKVGSGAEAKTGNKVTVNYKGTLTTGTQFDSSYDRGQPFSFTVGAGDVIAGWDQGIPGMKVGGKRKLTIPPSLGYGPQALPGIPANSTLIFEVELLKVE